MKALLLERPDYQVAYHEFPSFRFLIDGIVHGMAPLLQTAYDQGKVAEEKRKEALRLYGSSVIPASKVAAGVR